MKTGGKDYIDKGKAEKRFRLDEPRAALRSSGPGFMDAMSFREYLNALDIAAAAVRTDGSFIHANPALLRLIRYSRSVESPDRIATFFPEEAARDIDMLAARAVGGRSEAEISLVREGVERVLKVVAIPFGTEGETFIALTFQDRTRQRMIEQQAEQLMREVDHRVKNTMALVLSISNRTAANSESVEDFRRAFSGRMRVLAETHNTLAERSWASIRLSDILHSELRPFPSAVQDRFHCSGPDLGFLPRAAVAIGLILHELIANALRFGSLSGDQGHVSLDLFCNAGSPFAELHWRESGGPPVQEPRHSGFGRAVITRSLQYSPHGGAELEFGEGGVTCQMRVPVEDLA